jgi:hypothetical protein
MSTPAGWYPDPESPSQQRYWDGTRWTEHRAPLVSAPAPAPAAPVPPAAAPAPPTPVPPTPAPVPPAPVPPAPVPPAPFPGGVPGGPGPAAPGYGTYEPAPAPAKKSRKTLWIVLGVVAALIAVLVVIGVLAKDPSETLEDILPDALEQNYAKQGLDVDVTKADCGNVELEDGPFEVDCTISIAGSSRTVPADVSGTIKGNTINVTSASSTSNLVNEQLAIKAVQDLVTKVAPRVKVTSCDLPEDLLVLQKGDTFTCSTDSDEEVEITATSGKSIEITKVR